MLLNTLGANSLANLLTGKEVKAKMPGLQARKLERRVMTVGEGRIRAGQDF